MHRTPLNSVSGQAHGKAEGSDRPALRQQGEQAAVMLMSERALKAPLGALRVAIEGARASAADLPPAFLDRALDTIADVDHAADDLMAWAHPRPIRSVSCSVAELIASLRQTLHADTEARCHFVVDGAGTDLSIDGRLVVSGLERSIRRRLDRARQPGIQELMVHAHVEDGWTTISLIDADAPDSLTIATDAASSGAEALADALLARDCERMGGRVSIHETGGHRCMVVVLPSHCPVSTALPTARTGGHQEVSA